MFLATMREENKLVSVYAVDSYHDRFLVDYNGKFRWFDRSEFVPPKFIDPDLGTPIYDGSDEEVKNEDA